ncbi:phosphatase PAP2 family protein [Natronosalvus amylolyticus]|uniref:phosphatase PAP2 family protein n=1 Tax=Natronosalvus amylolyticus TaxID=2961994 RepID=UPI0020C93D4E|nr:phosphatase PAP2 family protein [Natronosalvus amylolyticus]
MLVEVLTRLALIVALMVVLGVGVFAGRQRLVRTVREWPTRVKAIAPITVLLATVLLFNSVARQAVPELSWLRLIRKEITWTIYETEGDLILWLQAQATPEVTAYFSFIYIYGYVFLLIFPVVVYFLLPNTRPLRELFTAYTLNYTLGLVCYILIIAYGPRNLEPELIQALLYDTYPQYQHLTRQVNRNTNVFPSLHTSLAATVAFQAYRTREIYFGWYLLTIPLALSVALSTMYLGIHWAIDVLAGIVLGWIAVVLAARLVGRWSIYDAFADAGGLEAIPGGNRLRSLFGRR